MTESIQGKQYEDAVYKEAQADGTITPGDILEYTGEDPVTVGRVSSNEPTGQPLMIAMEPPVPTDASTDPIDETYNDGDLVVFRVLRSGDTADNAWLASGTDLATASEANISVGDFLAPTTGGNRDGLLKEATTAGAEVAVAREAKDNSGGAGNNARIHVEAI